MSDLIKIDKNFKVETTINRKGLTFYDIDEKPFGIYGEWETDADCFHHRKSVFLCV